MQHHILNGDALKEQFPTDKIEGHLIVCRECLIDGDITGDSLMEFWDNRAAFIGKMYGKKAGKRYNDYVLPQFQKILMLSPNEVVNLWFGDDLFCQMNLCFMVALMDIVGHRENIYLVKAQRDNWQEFGGMSSEELVTAYENKQAMTPSEFQLLLACWEAFQQKDLAQLQTLASTKTTNFPLLQEVIQAHIDRFPTNGELGRPQKRLIAIKEELQTDDFGQVFQQFIQKEGIYGFGDTQVKAMWEALDSAVFNT